MSDWKSMTVGVPSWVMTNWAEAVEAMLSAATEKMARFFFIASSRV
jgi:hypothetical protein